MNTLHIFSISILFIHLAYLATFVGFASLFNETYVHYFNIFIQLIVCVFLIVRFSPFKKTYKLTKLDVATIFYCATFLLLNVVATELYNVFFTPFQTPTLKGRHLQRSGEYDLVTVTL